jgi:hypothetical protein
MMRLTGLSEVWVLCVLNPLLFALLAPFLVYVAGRVWGFDSDQRLFLLVTSLFVIDYSLLKITSIDGEMIGFYLSLVGCALFMTGRYLASVPFFCLSFASSVLNVFFPFILGLSFLVNLAVASPRRVDAGKILSLAIICAVFLLQVSPLFRKTSIIVDSQQSFEVTRIDIFMASSPTYSQSQYFLPKLLPSLLVTALYPVSYPVWSYLSKLAVPRVSGLVGYELTPEIMDDMHGFTLTAGAVFPAFIVLLFSFGFPVILLFAVLMSIHDGGKLVLIFCAYASMIVFSVLYMVTGFSLFPERVIPVIIGVFGIVLTLNYNEVKRRYGLIWNVVTVLALARAVVWTASVIVYGG